MRPNYKHSKRRQLSYSTKTKIYITLTFRTLSHPNIVQFFGIYFEGTDRYLVTEFITKGSLRSVLNSESTLTVDDLIWMAKDVAAGMLYLSQVNIIHRDLAARNLLVAASTDPAKKYLVKISDLGMGKSMEEDYYSSNEKTIPVKWCPPEVLEFGKFSIQSDIWSFGVVLWEIFSRGKVI
jgi:tyrosine-protein kinase Tec